MVKPFFTPANFRLLNQTAALEREEPEEGSKREALKTAIVRLSRWKAACDVLQSRDHEEKIQQLDSALKEMLDALAAGKSSRKGRQAGTRIHKWC
jgi:hypothetical protein